jgi:TRAP-type C4-dicarboxylate transport system substrate-binding protein
VRREYPIDGVLEIALLSNGRLSLTTQLSGLIFELNPDLSVYDITFTNTYKEKHNAARRAGETDIEMNDTYRQQLIKGVLYWENGEWTKATSSTK